MNTPRALMTEEQREKKRAWGRAYYEKRKHDPAYKAQFTRGRDRRRSDPTLRHADSRQVVEREKKMKRDPVMWPKWAYWGSKSRARKFGIPHTVKPSDILVPSLCPVFGVPFVFDGPKWHPNAPSLDRFIPALGYVPGNIRVISLRANRLKYDSTADELRSVIRYMESSP